MHPIAFDLGSYPVHWFGVMIALGFLAGSWTASRRAPRLGLPMEIVPDLIPWLVVGVLVGARTFYVITFWEQEFARDPFPEIFMVQHGGLVFYGGLIGGCLATLLFARVKKIPVWRLADILAPSIALGSAFGRIGCLLNGCCYGAACSLPWAIHFPQNHSSYPAGVHPVQVYDALLNLALYGALAWMFRHRRRFDGQVFAVFLVGYALFRSIAELFRGDCPVSQHFLGGLATPAHMVSIAVLLAGVALLALLPRSPSRPSPA